MLKTLLVPLLALMVTGCATHAATSGRVAIRDDRTSSELLFNKNDRAVVEGYYRTPKTKREPRGLVKNEQLPAGFAKNSILPPRLSGRLLPVVLEGRLPALPGAYVRLLIGRDMVLVHRNTRLVTDILLGALTCDVVLPAVVGAAQPAFFVSAKPERYAAMGTELIHQTQAALRVAKRNQRL